MPLQILGLNHNTAPVEIREQVAYAGDEVSRALERLTALDGIDEALLLSTCNRTEFYLVGRDGGRERRARVDRLEGAAARPLPRSAGAGVGQHGRLAALRGRCPSGRCR